MITRLSSPGQSSSMDCSPNKCVVHPPFLHRCFFFLSSPTRGEFNPEMLSGQAVVADDEFPSPPRALAFIFVSFSRVDLPVAQITFKYDTLQQIHFDPAQQFGIPTVRRFHPILPTHTLTPSVVYRRKRRCVRCAH